MNGYDINAPHYFTEDGISCAECLHHDGVRMTTREKWTLLKELGTKVICDSCRDACPVCHEVPAPNNQGCSCWLCPCMTTNHRTATECRSCHKEGNQ